MTAPHADHAPHAAPSSLTRRELVAIAAFWGAYGALTTVSRVFDQNGARRLGGTLAVAAIEALVWATLTAVVFMLAARMLAPPDDAARRRRSQLLLALLGVASAIAIGWLGSYLRRTLTPLGPPPGALLREGRRGGGGPPIWFGILNALVLYVGATAAGLARALSHRDRARREAAARREATLHAQLAEARLDALRRQLDPHFLFNTLNAVSALVERDPRGVRRMIARLSELLRHGFEGDRAPEVTLRDELALLARYVDIMQVRFQGRLTVETRVDDDVLDALVPSMILQPLVENAIKHGVERATTGGSVVIEADVDGDALVLQVCDDGPGIAAPEEGRRLGVGLRNTTARLAQLYGVAQQLTITPGRFGGTVAELRLPYHEQPVSAARHDA